MLVIMRISVRALNAFTSLVMRFRRNVPLVFLTLVLLSGCKTPPERFGLAELPEKYKLYLSGRNFQAVFMHPDYPLTRAYNGRFCRAAWLISLRTDEGQSIFQEESDTPNAYMLGCPFVFIADFPAESKEYPLRFGIGTVRRRLGRNSMYDHLIRPIRWSVESETSGSIQTIYFHQFVPRRYFFVLSVSADKNSNVLTYNGILLNLSGNPLEVPFYQHPFIRIGNDNGWYKVGSGSRKIINHFFEDKNNLSLPVTVGRGERKFFSVETQPPRENLQLWYAKLYDVFAVEPFGRLKALPDQTDCFIWKIKVGE